MSPLGIRHGLRSHVLECKNFYNIMYVLCRYSTVTFQIDVSWRCISKTIYEEISQNQGPTQNDKYFIWPAP